MKKIKRGIIFVLAFSMAMLVLQVNMAYAQEYDHYKVYNTTPFTLLAPITVMLTDQFGEMDGAWYAWNWTRANQHGKAFMLG